MAKQFEGKVCLITGAASGIGRATAVKMSGLGAKLAITDINKDGLNETNRLCGGDCFMAAFDIGRSANCEQFVKDARHRLDALDFVFNCAGVNPTPFDLEETRDEYWHKLMDTNLGGTYYITRAAIPYLQAGASIVNTSSILGLTAEPKLAIYCATKYGITGFTKAMAAELGPKQIRVNAVAPGYINTPTNTGVVGGPAAMAELADKVPLGRLGTPEEVADVVAFLFSNDSKYMNGSIVEVHGGRL